MGLPALKRSAPARTRSPHLRVVKTPKAAPRRRTQTAQCAAARNLFRSFALLVAVVAILGMGRVWLSVQAAQASLSSSDLRAQIKSERYEGDLLEVRRSALGSPSRIRAIAGKAMGMAPVGKVSYLDVSGAAARPAKTKTAAAPATAAPVSTASTTGGQDSALERLLDLTAGQAHTLLVGDVGVASAK